MTEIKCIFQEILLDNQDNIFEKYNKLVNEVNKGCKKYNKKEMKKYFIFNPENFINNITECTICFFNNYYEATILYEKNGEKLDKGFGITKYEFTLENKTYRCYERSYLIQYLENEYKKKKFYLKVLIDKYERINYSIFIQYNLRNFEIVYYYNYKPVTFKELTLEFAFNEKEQQKGEELNYEFANYIDLEEEEYNLFFYIKNFNRNFFLRNLEYRLRGMHYIELCGPFGCGKTITLLKYINCFRRRSYYINLWTVNYVEIQELKKILKYEYVKLIGKNYDINNEKDEIVSYINNLNSSKEIYDFILKVISSFKNTDKNIYLIIDQYSSKYDEKNKKIIDGANIWQEILKESTTKKESEEANIFVFGDKDTGKKSLIKIMNKEAAPQDYESKIAMNSEENLPFYGLMNYTHLVAKKILEDETEINKIGVWLMNELIDKNIVLNLVKPQNIINSICLIVVDYSRPWKIINSLKRWCDFAYSIFGDLILKLPLDMQNYMRKQSKKINFNIL